MYIKPAQNYYIPIKVSQIRISGNVKCETPNAGIERSAFRIWYKRYAILLIFTAFGLFIA
ncbi:hypothetical protein GCM10022209_41690 [Chitinophaga oryziterrae]